MAPEMSPKNEATFTRPKVVDTLKSVRLDSIVLDPDELSFRELEELQIESAGMKALIEDITACGNIHTPLLVKDLNDGHFLVVDGHRRVTALKGISDRGVTGFSPEMEVPANVMPPDTSQAEVYLRIASGFIRKRGLSGAGRCRLAVRLEAAGLPLSQIVKELEISESTLMRDLLVGKDDWALAHIDAREITHSAAASLLKEAKDAKGANRLDEFKEVFDRWVKETKTEIQSENDTRLAADKKALSGPQLWVQKRLDADLVESWVNALKAGRKLDFKSELRFRAGISKEKGVERIEISALNVPLGELGLKGSRKVFERLVDLADGMVPHMQRMAAEEKEQDQRTAKRSAGRNRLRELGLGDLADEADARDAEEVGSDGDDDPEFDRPATREENDLRETGEFPGGESQP